MNRYRNRLLNGSITMAEWKHQEADFDSIELNGWIILIVEIDNGAINIGRCSDWYQLIEFIE